MDKVASGGVDQSISMQDQLLELTNLMEMQIKPSLQNTPTMGGSLHDVRKCKSTGGSIRHEFGRISNVCQRLS